MPTVALRYALLESFCRHEIVNDASYRFKEFFDRAEPCSDFTSSGRSDASARSKTVVTPLKRDVCTLLSDSYVLFFCDWAFMGPIPRPRCPRHCFTDEASPATLLELFAGVAAAVIRAVRSSWVLIFDQFSFGSASHGRRQPSVICAPLVNLYGGSKWLL